MHAARLSITGAVVVWEGRRARCLQAIMLRWIVAATLPGMAAANTLEPTQAAMPSTVLDNRLAKKGTARRLKAAVPTQQRAERVPIHSHKRQQYCRCCAIADRPQRPPFRPPCIGQSMHIHLLRLGRRVGGDAATAARAAAVA